MLAIVHTIGVLSFGRLRWQTLLGDMSGDCTTRNMSAYDFLVVTMDEIVIDL
jgi:hypothetical protein